MNGHRHSSTRILVVRLGALGDIIHALPAVASLKHNYPGSHLTWAVEPRWAVLLDGNPFVDRVIGVDRGSGAGIARAWRELREQRFDFAVDLQGLVKSALVANVARTDRIYGHHPAQARERLAGIFYSDKVRTAAGHRVDANLEIVARAGASIALHVFPLPAGRREGSLPQGAFVLASPFSGWTSKQWPLEYYARLAVLLREFGLTLVLNGAPGAETALARVAGTVVHTSSIEGLIDATRRAAAVVGVDSGPLHLAAALGKPGVAIYGPTDPTETGPYGGSLTVLRSPGAITSYKRREQFDESMLAITPEAVLAALQPVDCLA